MDIVILRLLLRMVEQGIVISFRVTKDKVYIIIKKITALDVAVLTVIF